MELKLIKKDKNTITIEIIGEDETLLNPLTQRLLAEKDIEDARFIRGTILENPKIFLRVKDGKKPEIHLRNVSKKIGDELKEFEKIYTQAVKKK